MAIRPLVSAITAVALISTPAVATAQTGSAPTVEIEPAGEQGEGAEARRRRRGGFILPLLGVAAILIAILLLTSGGDDDDVPISP